LNVDGISLVVVITRATGWLQERLDKVAITPAKILLKRVIAACFDIALDAIEIVARMEIVDPMILRFFAIPPHAIRQLAMTTVAHSFTRHFQELSAGRVFPRAR
jgi:hypothetical protein